MQVVGSGTMIVTEKDSGATKGDLVLEKGPKGRA
jgi:hypothetical protein